MRILVTGGTGFIGARACSLFSQLGHQCVAYDLHPFNEENQVEFVQGDIRDADRLTQASRGADAILHLAAAHHDFGISTETFRSVNVGGAKNVCDAASANGIKHICSASSVAVYGQQKPPIDESSQPKPESMYGKTKLEAEAVFKEWSASGDSNRCLVIRPTVVFGPGNFANMYMLIRQIESGKFLRVGKMDNIKSLAYIDNLLQAMHEIWLNNPSVQSGFEIYNYVDKPDLTSREIVNVIYRELNRKPPAFAVPYPMAFLLAIPFEIVIRLTGKNLPVSLARIRKLAKTGTQFEADKIHRAVTKPLIPLDNAIAEMVRWYVNSGKDQDAPDRRPHER